MGLTLGLRYSKKENDMQTASSLPRRLVSILDAAQYTGLSVHTLYAMVSQRRIPFVKVGGRSVRFDVEMLDKWIKQHTVLPMPSQRS